MEMEWGASRGGGDADVAEKKRKKTGAQAVERGIPIGNDAIFLMSGANWKLI